MKRIFLLLLTVSLVWSCTSTKYYVVRHTERIDNSRNSALSPAGLLRAQALKDTLAATKIDLIYASTYIRTQQTARPTATAKNLQMIIYQPDTTAGLVAHLKTLKGKSVLVVGHSDTVPDIVSGLSHESVAPIADNDFDNLYIISVHNFFGARRNLKHVTYGKATP